MELPRYEQGMPVGKFKKFLTNCGAQHLHCPDKNQVIHIRTDRGEFLLWRCGDGKLVWTKEFVSAYLAYKSGGRLRWKASNRRKVSRKRNPHLVETLFARDGRQCWFCTRPLSEENVTLEHLLNVSSGGNNHVNNQTIACNGCNQKARNMSITEKVVLKGKLTRRYLQLAATKDN